MKNHSEILIIGGGVIGLCSAYYLRKAGHRVTLLEKGTIGSGSSMGNAGIIPPSHSIPLAAPGVLTQGIKWMLNPSSPFYIKPRLDADLLSWLWKFRAACQDGPMKQSIPVLRDLLYTSRDLYQSLIADEDLACDFEQKGLIMLFKTEAGLDEGRHEMELLRTYGAPATELIGNALRAVEPAVSDAVIGGIHFQDDAHFHPARFMDEMARRVDYYGATIEPETEVTGIDIASVNGQKRINSVTTVQPSGPRTFTADQVVLAAGSWSPNVARNLGLSLPIQPGKGYSVSVANPANGPSHPLIAHERRMAITPMGDTLRLAGTMELSGLNLDVSEARVTAIRAAADEYLKLDERVPAENVWVGMRPLTPDGLPIISRVDQVENLVVATGHAMLGMAMGPITGKLVAQIIDGEEPNVDLEPLRAGRW